MLTKDTVVLEYLFFEKYLALNLRSFTLQLLISHHEHITTNLPEQWEMLSQRTRDDIEQQAAARAAMAAQRAQQRAKEQKDKGPVWEIEIPQDTSHGKGRGKGKRGGGGGGGGGGERGGGGKKGGGRRKGRR